MGAIRHIKVYFGARFAIGDSPQPPRLSIEFCEMGQSPPSVALKKSPSLHKLLVSATLLITTGKESISHITDKIMSLIKFIIFSNLYYIALCLIEAGKYLN